MQCLKLDKSEHLTYREANKLNEEISQINNSCNVISKHYSTLPNNWWDSILVKYLYGSIEIPKKDEFDNVFDSFSLEHISIRSVEKFIIFSLKILTLLK